MIRPVLLPSAWIAYGAYLGHATGGRLAIALGVGVATLATWAALTVAGET